ncbi:MAG: PEP-CTERM sorting domain-containing protein [Geobacteraceae bacterium]|nr:PEP-CTERM sorting domain-containing protein [Geobacteraceae bacterium]
MVFYIKRKRRQNHGASGEAESDEKPRRTKLIVLIILLLALLASNLFLFKQLQKTRKVVVSQHKVLEAVQEPQDAASEVQGKWYGLCEKNSIHSIDDFRKIVENDEVLGNHFADFDWANASMGRLESPIWTHLAYRKNDKISTTRRVIRLPVGDGYITDGKRWLRTFCCNDYIIASPPRDLSASPERYFPPTTDNPEKELDKILKDPSATAVVTENTSKDGGGKKPGEHDLAVVPEPSTLIMTGFGITIVVLEAWRRGKSKNTDRI